MPGNEIKLIHKEDTCQKNFQNLSEVYRYLIQNEFSPVLPPRVKPCNEGWDLQRSKECPDCCGRRHQPLSWIVSVVPLLWQIFIGQSDSHISYTPALSLLTIWVSVHFPKCRTTSVPTAQWRPAWTVKLIWDSKHTHIFLAVTWQLNRWPCHWLTHSLSDPLLVFVAIKERP